jgi:hypothetical protein
MVPTSLLLSSTGLRGRRTYLACVGLRGLRIQFGGTHELNVKNVGTHQASRPLLVPTPKKKWKLISVLKDQCKYMQTLVARARGLGCLRQLSYTIYNHIIPYFKLHSV